MDWMDAFRIASFGREYCEECQYDMPYTYPDHCFSLAFRLWSKI